MTRFIAALCLLTLLLHPSAVAADEAGAAPAAAVRAGPVAVIHADGDAGYARAVAALAAAAHERIRDDLGLAHPVEAAVLLLTANSPEATREEWARRLPAWMAGAAIPVRQFIVVRVAPGQTPQALEPLLAHELTHVILRVDYPGHDGWPLWFQEGLAMRESRTEGLLDHLRLSAAALFDRVPPLESLSVRFPEAEPQARLAYAQSASFLAFLEARAGRGRFGVLMQELRLRAARTRLARAQVWTLRDALLRIGTQVTTSLRRIVLSLPRCFPYADAWGVIARSFGACAP